MSEVMAPTSSLLTQTQRYAAGALFGLSLHQSQMHQTRPTSLLIEEDFSEERISTGSSSSDSVSEDPQLWVHECSGLLRPVFQVLNIDSAAWPGLEETAGSVEASHHVAAFIKLLAEESCSISTEQTEKQLALSNAIDEMEVNMERVSDSFKDMKERHQEYKQDRREKYSVPDVQPNPETSEMPSESTQTGGSLVQNSCNAKEEFANKIDEEALVEVAVLSYQTKVTVLYELLSACLADKHGHNKKYTRRRKGYDARQRVCLRFLATWLDVEWHKVEAIETIVACSAMALLKAKESTDQEDTQATESKWAKWKRGGIIGAAALTGGALMAITGGLAAPAIAAGLGALAPTLGTLIPVIGAGGFAAAASAAGTVVGSVAVAASFGDILLPSRGSMYTSTNPMFNPAAGAGLTGTKMARRVGAVDEFEFKAIGENQNKGRLAVEILISGFVFEEDDFIMPWEGLDDNLDRYALQWESKKLIAVSTAIQDWITSGIALELMKRGAMMTVLSGLMTALAWPAALLSATNFIDSKWTIAIDRSDKAGKLLADVLLKGEQGNRPVTLIGYSLGARVIFKCLQVLAENETNPELVERVVLLGAPISIKDEKWEAARKMVAGRFINAYSKNDWMLGIAFRASLLSKGLAGIQPVHIPGIQNVDVSDLVEGHSSYLWNTPKILQLVELETCYPVFRSTLGKQ